MRTIKFRAWDKERRQMRYQNIEYFRIGLRHNKEGNEFWKELSMSVDNFYTPEQGELMQYTGIKDKNGKEIYEGDILSSLYRTGLVSWYEEQGEWITTWRVDKPKRGQLDTYVKQTYMDVLVSEVIGNIYENPELLAEGGKL